MVGIDLTVEEDLHQPSKPKQLEDSIDHSPPENNDFALSLADSFLDLDSLKDWIEEGPYPDWVEFGAMEEGIKMSKDVGSLSSLMEDDMKKVTLVANCEASAVRADISTSELDHKDGMKSCEIGLTGKSVEKTIVGSENGVIKKEEISHEDGSDASSDSESSSSSSSCYSSSSSSSEEEEEEEDDDDDDDSNDDEGEEVEEEGREYAEEEERKEGVVGVEVEEGEITEFDEERRGGSDDDEDDDGFGVTRGPIKSKHEIENLPPVPRVDVTLEPYHRILPVGVVLSVIGPKVIVEGMEKHNPLNEGSILWITESRSPLGIIDEIFGPVKNPFYAVRYNNHSEVPSEIKEGSLVSFVPEFAEHILNDSNLYKKGYDASNEYDEELSDEAEFSDDEKEAQYKRMLKMSKRSLNEQKFGSRGNEKEKTKNRGRGSRNDQSRGQRLVYQHQNRGRGSRNDRSRGPPRPGQRLVDQHLPNYNPPPKGGWRKGMISSQKQRRRPLDNMGPGWKNSQSVSKSGQFSMGPHPPGFGPPPNGQSVGTHGLGQLSVCPHPVRFSPPPNGQSVGSSQSGERPAGQHPPGLIPTFNGVWMNGMMPCQQQQPANVVWTNSVMPYQQQQQQQQNNGVRQDLMMPCQTQQVPVFPNGLQTCGGMPWMQHSQHHQPSCQIPCLIQQQFDHGQTLPPNAALPQNQSSVFAAPPLYGSGLGPGGQSSFDQTNFVVGSSHLNNGLMISRGDIGANVEGNWQFNQGPSSVHGVKPFRRAGRFSGGGGQNHRK